MHWVNMNEYMYLLMENAGGHSRNDAIKKYTIALKAKYNVKRIHQVPRSSYCNTLDLEFWCSLPVLVEKVHFMRRYSTTSLV